MFRPRRLKSGFAHNEGLLLIAIVGISLGLFLPALRQSMDAGLSWWLSPLLGLGLVALFWLAFATVATVFIRVAMWIEEEWRR